MPGKSFRTSNRVYLGIIQGRIRQTVDEHTDGATRRDYELPSGVKGTKYEIVYFSWSGVIKSLEFKEWEKGENLNIEFEDAILSIDTNSKYFSSFVQKLKSIDISREIEIAPYDYEPEKGKRQIGVNIIQDGRKAQNYYYDVTSAIWVNGYPKPVGNTKSYKKDDWTVFYVAVKKFLKSEIESLGMQRKQYTASQDTEVDSIPVINVKKSSENEEKELDINDVPF